jgi:hypothetical protein
MKGRKTQERNPIVILGFFFHFDRGPGPRWGIAGKGPHAATQACRPFARTSAPRAELGTGFGGQAENHAMLTVILFVAGLVCFALFFKTIDYFEKI